MKTEEKKAGYTEGRLEIKNERTSSFFSGEAGQISILMAGGEKIAVIGKNQEGNANRLKAAWNDCESIPTKALESGVVGEMVRESEENAQQMRSAADLLRKQGFENMAIALLVRVEVTEAVLAKAKGEL